MELSREKEELVGQFRQWLDSCSPDDFLPPDCAVGAERTNPSPILPTLEADVGAIALLEERDSEQTDTLQCRGFELCLA